MKTAYNETEQSRTTAQGESCLPFRRRDEKMRSPGYGASRNGGIGFRSEVRSCSVKKGMG